ncbi:MAG TPA: hemopexin repeat-containing protein [Rhodothermales bacterium]|nr:hemopexin repeat-containing protein [Rhodothermales bacterium]
MFDTVDAAFYYPSRGHAYFFKGSQYMKYRPGRGVVLLSGRTVRNIGIDGWTSLPSSFRQDIDAALHYPPNGHTYFFKEDKYIKYRPGDGVVPLGNGEPIRTIAVDGWQSFPSSFSTGIDAALFYPDNSHAYFFRGGNYIKYRPGVGVVPIGSREIRKIGDDGWDSFPPAFRAGIDAAMNYPSNGKLYFFRGRDYIRWEPGDGVDARYPRRLGLIHRRHGGWPGLSHVIAGPLVGPVTDHTARIWIWMTDGASADRLQVHINGTSQPYTAVDPVGAQIVGSVDAFDSESQIRVLELRDLSPATNYTAEIMLGDAELDSISFRTAPAAAVTGKVTVVFGSCSNMSASSDVPAFEAMNRMRPHLGLLCGDNCYYVHAGGTTGAGGPRPRDWESIERMLLRQVEARNHPQFTRLSRSVPLYSTWDDHDFGYNNAAGTDLQDDWVGSRSAAAVFRAMWPNAYMQPLPDQPIFHSFRWGPIEVFMTDSRFRKADGIVWGAAQLKWLVKGLRSSEAPLKIVVTSGQFLFNRDDQEGHPNDAPNERLEVLNHVIGSRGRVTEIPGRVLFLSGDVHYSELLRLPGQGPAVTLELTSSPLRKADLSGNPPAEKAAGSRIWAAKRNGFGLLTIDISATGPGKTIIGTVILEIRDSKGDPVVIAGRPCRTTWDLSNGSIV